MSEFNTYDDKDSIKDGYPQFEANLQSFFDKAIDGGKPLFKTNVEDLYDIYLNNISAEREGAKQHFTCNACKTFINRFGGLVTINEDGKMESVMWDENSTPQFFIPAVSAMKKAILNSKVNGVFIPEERVLGIPKTGEWSHLAIRLPQEMTNRSVLRNAHQVMAKKRENFGVLTRSIQDFSLNTVNQAMVLLESETMYRADRVAAPARWFKQFLEKLAIVTDSEKKRNLMWLAVATQPDGFVKIRSGMIGTLFEDIAEGLTTQRVAARFAEKMSPGSYMRSQSAPSVNSINQAEKIIEKLGIANSLKRRYATLEEIPSFVWQNHHVKKDTTTKAAGVFGHLVPKAATSNVMSLPSSVMTWEKFQRTILPTAESVEALVDNPNRFMALVTAVDETAENILQWDNPFSWYYHGGIDGEIKRRVEEAGGRYENNEIRASLIWESHSDLDIHVLTPQGEHIYFGNKRDRRDGFLDIDMNAGGGQTMTPVENIRWPSNAPEGRYRFYVHNFADRNKNYNPYKVELNVGSKIFTFNGVATKTGYQEDAFVFDYVKGQEPRMLTNSHSSEDAWKVSNDSFVKVNAITTSPNLWSEKPLPQSGEHTFFLLDGVQDSSEGKGRGFFNETIKSELHEIRKTLEAYTANTPIEDADKATACGIGFSKDGEWNLTLKVTSNNSTRIIKVDRWD